MSNLSNFLQLRDITSGMCYLHSIPFVHRRLEMRNILLGEKLNAKISDFGMYETKIQSHYLANLRQQCMVNCDYLPIHKAPEMIQRNEFTTAGDVYSYGEHWESPVLSMLLPFLCSCESQFNGHMTVM